MSVVRKVKALFLRKNSKSFQNSKENENSVNSGRSEDAYQFSSVENLKVTHLYINAAWGRCSTYFNTTYSEKCFVSPNFLFGFSLENG